LSNEVSTRVTIDLADDVAGAARALANAERRSLGKVISELARRGLTVADDRIGPQDGFPVFRVSADAPVITSEMVQAALGDI
jgi:hypothetical protein